MNAAELNRVTVVGAGTMGAGIAGEFARAGCAVRLVDRDDRLLRRGVESMRAAQEVLIRERLVTRRKAAAAFKRVHPLTSLPAACDQTQLLIEAVFEDLSLKRRLFRQLDALCPRTAVLVSNTSGLSITRIAAATRRPNLVAGLHFWNPPHVIPLVEVTKGKKTSRSTARFLMDVCRRIGKRPILVLHDVPGFVGNRLQFAVVREALNILSRGIASAADIDAAMTDGPGLRYPFLGPLRTADLGGLDVFRNIGRYLFRDLSSDAKPVKVLEQLVSRGRLGAKSGKGFYTYSPKDVREVIARRDRILLKLQRVLKEH